MSVQIVELYHGKSCTPKITCCQPTAYLYTVFGLSIEERYRTMWTPQFTRSKYLKRFRLLGCLFRC